MTLDRVHASLIHTLTSMTERAGGDVERDADQVRYASRSTDPVLWNGVVALGVTEDPASYVARAVDFFRARDRRATVWTQGSKDTALELFLDAGPHQALGDSPEMVLTEPVPVTPVDGLEISSVARDEQRAAFVDVLSQSFAELGADPMSWALTYPDVATLVGDDVYAVLGTLQGTPVSAAVVYIHDGVGEVIHVGTLPDARGKGIAEALTRAVTTEAFARGADLISLQATPLGEPVYRRIGFATVDRYRWYLLETS